MHELKEIADWYNSAQSVIPSIQRDLVWSPKQMADLWDSILRGFPIGIITLFEDNKKEPQVLDGQQRLNAIAVGYGTYQPETPNAILWLDLDTHGGFAIMTTTLAHPWGFRKDNESSVLSANDRREAIKQYCHLDDDEVWNFYNSEPLNLYKTWPYKAQCPIPLSILLNIDGDSEELFVDKVKADYEKRFPEGFNYFKEQLSLNDENIQNLYEKFCHVKSYHVSTTTVSLTTIKDIELLFTRINRGGTNINEEDLAYSTIKAYFTSIKEKEEEVRKVISPAKLARIVLRIIQTEMQSESQGFVGNLSLNKIRELGDEENLLFRQKVFSFYQDISGYFEFIKTIFDSCGVPKPLRASISNNPDLIMLLLYIKYKGFFFDDNLYELCGMILYAHWFCFDTPRFINICFNNLKDKKAYKHFVKTSISQSIARNIATPLLSPNEFKHLIRITIDENDKWSTMPKNHWPWLWDKVRENREMLLFFQRGYIDKTFGKYDPKDTKRWIGHNCPWDYDHIVPQNWFHNYSDYYKYARFCRDWKDCIGNLAAIPFETNRSKSDSNDWDYYETHPLLKVEVEKIKTVSSDALCHDKDIAQNFAAVVYDRCCDIYKDCYDELFAAIFSMNDEDMCPLARIRKSTFLSVMSTIPDCNVFFVSQDDEKEFPLQPTQDQEPTNHLWSMPWLSCGTILRNLYFVSLTIGVISDQNKLEFEIGVRKRPGLQNIDLDQLLPDFKDYATCNNEWWYFVKTLNDEEVDIITIKERFQDIKCFIENLK